MRMDFYESMAKYGNDKPDLRFGLEHVVLTDLIREHGEAGGVPMMFEAVQNKGIVKAMVIPADKAMSRAESDKLEEFAKQAGARGLARAKVAEGGEWTQSPLSKLGLIPEYGSGGNWKFLWVVNPPLFEFDEETNTWAAAHHAFTRPHDADVDSLLTDPGRVKCHRYDVVLNGFEIGGGSIRLHDPKVQAQVFKALGIGDEEAQAKFGFLLDALKFGAPPHGGIALGMDRLAFLLTNAESLRDVIPFPKTKTGTDQMTGAPGEVDDRQLKELHVRPVPPPQK
jgi:aspartyl-tRNA synthetase